ncbi:MAG: HEAT repeat domain-containing protein [Cyanobacteria bacterium]|nr:HEAT repeat domain-containing protein [Cyanobacteriota bacterium]
MAAPQAPPEPLSPEIAGRLAEFAKACKAATRIVSMYPATHPNIQSALSRIGEATRQATSEGPFAITVLPDALLVDGRGLPKPESSATELASLLHLQLIGGMTLFDRLDNAGWHAFLSLLSKSPEDARALGGVAKAWEATGNKAIVLTEIDYAEVLRERGGTGDSASWDRILTALKSEGFGGSGPDGAPQNTMAAMREMAEDSEKLAQFAQKLQTVGKESGDDSIQQRKSLLELMHGLANYTAEREPEQLNAVLDKMAGAAAQMSPDMLLTLITDPPPLPGGSGPRMDLAGELQARLTDEMLTKFLVDNIVKDRGASNRLATAFQTLVPDPAKQKDILAAATEQAAAMFKDDPQFENIWSSSSEMLMSYSDAKFVSEGYARELTTAQTQAVDIEKIGDDPPVRIRAWLSTVSDTEVRALDQHLILDLLRIESRPDAWAGVLDTAINLIDQLVLVGDLPLASQLLEAIVAVSKAESSPFKTPAAAGITRLVGGPMVRHLSLFLQKATEAEFTLAKKMCATIGPSLVKPMSDALMAEVNSRNVRRLREILVSFGPAARQYANELKSSRNPAVRRAAIDLLRGLAGDAALPELRQMLDDADGQVQREALRAIVQVGTTEAYQVLEKALKSGAEHTRDAIMQSLGSIRDEKAAPLYLHILSTTEYKGASEGIYTQLIETIGKVAVDETSANTLKDILYRGEWWARARTARLRTAAARALRSMGTPGADRVLEEAAVSAPGAVRKIALAALAEPAPPRRRKDSTVVISEDLK